MAGCESLQECDEEGVIFLIKLEITCLKRLK